MPKTTPNHKPLSVEDIALKTCKGDVRQIIVDRWRAQTKLFSSLSERDQQDEIRLADLLAHTLVRQVTELVATNAFDTTRSTLGKWAVDKGMITLQVNLPATSENVAMLLQAKELMVVHATPEQFLNERRPTLADKDQPELMDGEPIQTRDEAVAMALDAAETSGHDVDRETGEVRARAPRGHRKATTTAQRVADRSETLAQA